MAFCGPALVRPRSWPNPGRLLQSRPPWVALSKYRQWAARNKSGREVTWDKGCPPFKLISRTEGGSGRAGFRRANPGLVAAETNREATTTKTCFGWTFFRISAELRAPSSTGRRLVHQGRASADLAARAVDLADVARRAWFDFSQMTYRQTLSPLHHNSQRHLRAWQVVPSYSIVVRWCCSAARSQEMASKCGGWHTGCRRGDRRLVLGARVLRAVAAHSTAVAGSAPRRTKYRGTVTHWRKCRTV